MRGRAVLIALLLAATTGCASTYMLRPSDRTPAATGKIKAKADENGNRELKVQVKHLPPPSNLEQTMRTFVVWLRPNADVSFRNVGQLRLNDDRSGELSTTTPLRSFEVLVTAEASGTPPSPSDIVVLRGHVDAR